MDEDEIKPAKNWVLGCDLEAFGVAELEAYAQALEGELARVKATKEGKQAYLGNAAKLFKS
ncbi:MAG: DUF1192 domain-containing protein [Rhodospirillales bacterium]|nr:DUF1192 domain-containing protein [Rhodospirillales bacterium]